MTSFVIFALFYLSIISDSAKWYTTKKEEVESSSRALSTRLARAPDHLQSGASRLSDNLYYTDF